MRKSSLERLKDAKRVKTQPVTLDFDGLLRLLLGGKENPTQREFICDDTRLRAYKGPAGCAKTSTICAAGLLRALLQPGSKGLVARLDYNDLLGTTALRMQEMLGRLPPGVLIDRDKTPPMKWWIQPAIPDSEVSMITFMGLKESLGSYEFNWAIIDEADEVDEKRIHEINTRLRNPGGDYMVALSFNPPDKHHWLYTACTGKDFKDKTIRSAWLKLYEPQSRENLHNLPSDYYDRLAASLPEDMKQRLVEGEWGSTFDGQAVYREFKYGLHVKDGLVYEPNTPLIRMWDFGYQRPACIFAQLDWQGRLIVLKEYLGEREEASAFAKRMKAATTQHFPGVRDFRDYGDPAVAQHKDMGSTLAEFHRNGITILYKRSTIDEGVQKIRQMLSQLIEGEPACVISRQGCPILISALRGGYHFDKHGQKPVKDGYYDHLADAFRYGVINLFNSNTTRIYDLPASVAYSPEFDLG